MNVVVVVTAFFTLVVHTITSSRSRSSSSESVQSSLGKIINYTDWQYCDSSFFGK